MWAGHRRHPDFPNRLAHDHAELRHHLERVALVGEQLELAQAAGQPVGVDEELIREGRLKPLTDPRALELAKRESGSADRVRRDPALMLELLLSSAD